MSFLKGCMKSIQTDLVCYVSIKNILTEILGLFPSISCGILKVQIGSLSNYFDHMLSLLLW